MTDTSTSCVTDGFTGNVVLKTLEGGMKTVVARAARGVRRRAELQAARRRADAGAAAAVQDARAPTPTAAPCCSGSTACASSATDRRRPRRSSTRIGVAREMVEARRRRRDPRRHRRQRLIRTGPPAPDCSPTTERRQACRPRRHVEQGPHRSRRIFEIVRDRLADILEIEPATSPKGSRSSTTSTPTRWR